MIAPQLNNSQVDVTFTERDREAIVSLNHTGLSEDFSWLAPASWVQSIEKIDL